MPNLNDLSMILASTLLLTIANLFAPNQKMINSSQSISLKRMIRLSFTCGQNKTIYLALLGLAWLWLIVLVTLSHLNAFIPQMGIGSGAGWTIFLSLLIAGVILGCFVCASLSRKNHPLKYLPAGILLCSFFLIDLFLASKHASTQVTTPSILGASYFHTLQKSHLFFSFMGLFFFSGFYFYPLLQMIYQAIKNHHPFVKYTINGLGGLYMLAACLIALLINQLHWSLNNLWLILGILNLFVSIFVCKIFPHAMVQSFIRWTLRFLFKVKVTGLENYHNASKRMIIIANHISYLDIILIAAFIPDRLHFAIKPNESHSWWMRLSLSLIDFCIFEYGNPMSTKTLIKSVRQHKPCVIFPEGRLSTTGALMKIYEEPALVADKAQALVLPLRIDGVKFSVFSKLKNIKNKRWLPTISITILPPVPFELSPSIKGRKRRVILGTKLYDTMTHMMFESSKNNQTLFASLLNARRLHGKKTVIAEDHQNQSVNYQKLVLKSYILSEVINQVTHPSEYVGIMLPNSLAAVVTFFAMQAGKRFPAMINFGSGAKSIIHCCTSAQVKTIISSKKFIELAELENVIDDLKNHGIEIRFLEDLADNIRISHKIKGLIKSSLDSIYLNSVKNINTKETPAVALFTSGSEGSPKGVLLTHYNIQANRMQVSTIVDFGLNDICFNALPMFHSFGLTTGTLLPILSGMHVVLYPSPLHYRIIPEMIYDKNATMIFATNTFLSGYAKCAHAYDFHTVRYIFAGAEPIKDSTKQIYMEKFGIRILEGYGCTEAAPLVSVNTFMQYKKGSVGRILPALSHRIEPVEGIDQGGRLYLKGPNIMLGYLKTDQPGIVQRPEGDWHDTGDIVYVDDDKYLFIVGRLKRFAKIAGEMVSLNYIEHMAQECWPDHQHAVVARADENKGEQTVLYTTYPNPDKSTLIQFAKDHGYNELQTPNHIYYIETIPVLGSGKTDYVSIQKISNEESWLHN